MSVAGSAVIAAGFAPNAFQYLSHDDRHHRERSERVGPPPSYHHVERHAAKRDGGQVGAQRGPFRLTLVADGLSGPHRAYLAAGGKGFLLGDGALRYGPESLVELYYYLSMGRHLAVTPDAMLIANPGYNRDRGPTQVYTIRTRVVW